MQSRPNQSERAAAGSGLGIAALVAVLLVLLTGADPAVSRHKPRHHKPLANSFFYGVGAQFLFRSREIPPGPSLSRIRRSAIRVLRHGELWHVTEPRAPQDGVHTYEWDRWDAAVSAAANKRLRIAPVIAFGTEWANGEFPNPRHWRFPPMPEHYRDLAAYAGALAARYGRRGEFWEGRTKAQTRPFRVYDFWTESNHSRSAWDPVEYARAWRLVNSAIKAQDPRARVLFGGLGWPGSDRWLKRAFAAVPALRRETRDISLHIYGDNAERTLNRLREMRVSVDAAAGAGPRKKLYITETGLTIPPGDDEARRVRFIKRMVRWMPRSRCGVRAMYFHTWISLEQDPSNRNDWFGIANADGTLKPSGRMLKRQVRLMRGRKKRPPPRHTPRVCSPRLNQNP